MITSQLPPTSRCCFLGFTIIFAHNFLALRQLQYLCFMVASNKQQIKWEKVKEANGKLGNQ